MEIYLLTQSSNQGYDTYDSCVVIASSQEEAKLMHPGHDHIWVGHTWKSMGNSWCFDDRTWANPEDISVEWIGTAPPDATPKVILASFNAG
jgi:hypothetical protein